MELCANPLTVETMAEHIDVDLSGMLRLEMMLDQAADKTLGSMAHTVNGRLAAAEALRRNEFVLTKLYRGA
jgi:(2R)-sulfolactate sulfo-lyase subunit beta